MMEIKIENQVNYYHFIFDNLAPVVSYLHLKNVLNDNHTVYYTGKYRDLLLPFFSEIKPLEKNYKVSSSRRWSAGTVIDEDFDNYVLENRWISSFNGLKIVRERMLSYLGLKEEERDTIILIERTNCRLIENSQEIKEFFSGFNFKLLELKLESFSIEDQIRLMNKTKLLVGAHGAGFTNSIFMPRESYILEFFPKKFITLCYKEIAKLFGLKYMDMEGENEIRELTPEGIIESHKLARFFPSAMKDRASLRDIRKFSVNKKDLVETLVKNKFCKDCTKLSYSLLS